MITDQAQPSANDGDALLAGTRVGCATETATKANAGIRTAGKWALLVLGVLVLGGCAATPPAEFYVLTPMATPSASGAKAEPANGASIGVGPVRLPDYLDGPQLVTRPAPNRLRIDEFHRWGGTLEGNLIPVLAQNLSILLGIEDVVRYPWDEPVDPEYRVRLDVLRFDGVLGGSVDLDTRWEIIGPHPSDRFALQLLGAGRTVLSEPVTGEGYEALVAAQSRALASLSRELANQMRVIADLGS